MKNTVAASCLKKCDKVIARLDGVIARVEKTEEDIDQTLLEFQKRILDAIVTEEDGQPQ